MSISIIAERLDLSGITSVEILHKFLTKFTEELKIFTNNFVNSLPKKEVNALNGLFQNKDEYSELAFADIVDRFLNENKGIEQKILKEIQK